MNSSDDSGKTSRRSFTKTIAGGLATIPFISSFVRVDGKPRSSIEPLQTHDTPPPIEISDGSLRIETNEDLGQPQVSGQRFLYKRTQQPKLKHIRVLRGNGDKIYEDLEANGSSIDIEWKSDTPPASDHLKVRGGTFFEIDSDQRFPPPQAGTGRRPFRYQHPGPPGVVRKFRIESVEITNRKAARTKFTAPPTGTGNNFLQEEYRIMVWRE